MEDREPYITGGKMRDKFLTEAMGDCWHEWKTDHWDAGCLQCHAKRHGPNVAVNNDFSTWEGFGKLWSFSIEQEWWGDFIGDSRDGQSEFDNLIDIDSINPDCLADAIYEYLKNRG